MFNTFYYFPLLILTAFIYWLIPSKKYRIVFLSLISYGIIFYLDKSAFFTVIALTALTYLIAIWLEKTTHKKFVLTFGIICLIGFLGFFKYNGSLTVITNLAILFIRALPAIQIHMLILPLGISYIVFKYISYLTDIYWGLTRRGDLFSFICYGSLFTTFISGPIERFERLDPQFTSSADSFKEIYLQKSFQRIVFGLFKKIVIADWLGFFIAPVWQNPGNYNAFILALALMGYSLQIYFDFAGYSDVAIGSSQLFGLSISENFNSPYLASNISQFWSKWHISLSSWIRDYVFFPLSRMFSNKIWLVFLVPVIAMGICGIWHGKESHFLLWGIWHGLGLSLYQIFRKHKSKIIQSLINTPVATLTFVTIGWAIFHTPVPLKTISFINGLLVLALMPILSFIVYRFLLVFSRFNKPTGYKSLTILLIITLALQCLVLTNFIYMKF